MSGESCSLFCPDPMWQASTINDSPLLMCYDIGGKEIRLLVRRFSIQCAFILAPLTCYLYPICFLFYDWSRDWLRYIYYYTMLNFCLLSPALSAATLVTQHLCCTNVGIIRSTAEPLPWLSHYCQRARGIQQSALCSQGHVVQLSTTLLGATTTISWHVRAPPTLAER